MQAVQIARRVLTTTVLAAATLVATAGPAAAHRCTTPSQILVGKPTTVSVGVTVEATSPKFISILIPNGMQIEQIFPAAGGWTGRLFPPKSAREVLYERGSLEPYTCAYFPVRVTAKTRGVYVLSVDQLLPDGTVARFPSSSDYFVLPNGKTTHRQPGEPPNPLFEQVVYAGVPVGTVPNASGAGAVSVPNEGGGGSGGVSPVLIAVAVGGGLGVLWFGLRLRDRRASRKRRRLQLGEPN
jgi:hypothetical protein